jgi:hypothetical protein
MAENFKQIKLVFIVTFIAVLLTRVYDDFKIRHTGGYPNSFFKKIPKFPFLKLIFENDQASIWEIMDQGRRNPSA